MRQLSRNFADEDLYYHRSSSASSDVKSPKPFMSSSPRSEKPSPSDIFFCSFSCAFKTISSSSPKENKSSIIILPFFLSMHSFYGASPF